MILILHTKGLVLKVLLQHKDLVVIPILQTLRDTPDMD